jgi:predicted metal-dependent hydrolase
MTSSKTITDEDLGEIKLTKYKGARYLRIRIIEKGSIKVSLPYQVSYQEGLNFLSEKKDWIKAEYLKIDNNRAQLKLINPEGVVDIPDETPETITQALETNFATKFRKLELIPCDLNKATYRLSPSKIKIYYPKTLSPKNEKVETIIKTAIEDSLRKEAEVYLPKRLKELADNHGLKFRRVFIRNTRTRWGSCSHENNINLCIHLMKLPDELIDYVLLHELAHTVEKNHSKKFWDLLTELLGQNSKLIDKKLKAYKTQLVLA